MYIYYNNILFSRVTSLIRKYQNFQNINSDVLKKKAEIGTKTHENIEYFLNYKMDPPDPTEYYEGFKQFNREKEFINNEILAVEERVFCEEYLVTGAIDCIVNFRNKEIALIDWKTSSMFHEDYMSLQTCIYKILYENNLFNCINIDNCYVVLLKNYASYSIHKINLTKYIPLAYQILEENINDVIAESTENY